MTRIAACLARMAPTPRTQMLDPMPSDIAATSSEPGTIMSFATAYSMISTAPGQGDHAGRERQDAAFRLAAVAVAMMVPVRMGVIMVVVMTMPSVAACPQRGADGLAEHVETDADDDEEARGAHAGHVREPQPEAAAQHEVGQPDNDDGGDDVDDGDLQGHYHTAHHPRLAPEEVGDDDELPVPRPECMDGAVGERDRKGQEEGAEVFAPLDGVHVEGYLGVGAALEVHQEVRHPVEQAAALLDDLDLDGGPGRALRSRSARARAAP